MSKIIDFQEAKDKYYKFRCKPCPNKFELNSNALEIILKDSIKKLQSLGGQIYE